MAGYVKIQEIIDDIMEHPLLTDVTQERIIKYAARFMQIVGVPNMFEEKTAVLEVTKYKAELPCDFYNILGVRTVEGHHSFRATTDIYHMSEDKRPRDFYRDLTYKIQGNYIFTSLECGKIEVAYMAMPVDEDGLPMIVDNEKYKNALELYIKKRLFTNLFDQQKLHQSILQNVQQEYAFAVGQAQNDLIMPTIDEMEAITNSWTTAIQRVTEHRDGFVNNGNQELLRRH